MSWFEVSRGRLAYGGRIDRAPFDAWIATPEGANTLDAAASRLHFKLFGRQRAARREMWNLLSRAASTEPLRASLHAAADEYTRSICELPYAAGLPRTQVGNRRVVVVPRVMIAGRARTAVTPMVGKSFSLSQIDDALLAFFLDEVIVQLDHAVTTRPSDALAPPPCVGRVGLRRDRYPVRLGRSLLVRAGLARSRLPL